MKNILSLDLELNQPCKEIPDAYERIIQVGWAIHDIDTGSLIKTECRDIYIEEQLNPFIIELTGITDEDLNKGVSIQSAAEDVAADMKQFQCFHHIITWGIGDIHSLLKESGNKKIYRRFIDAKALYQSYRLANSKSYRAGLAKACVHMGVSFEGRAHNAEVDALNTGEIYLKLLDTMKEASEAKSEN